MDTYVRARKKHRLLLIVVLSAITGCSQPSGVQLEHVRRFGSNPGDLRMFRYVPRSLVAGAPEKGVRRAVGRGESAGIAEPSVGGVPLVVALHGCMQDAQGFGEDSGWIELADRWGFLLLLPEQRRGNSLTLCFNWYSPDDNRRDRGEVLSILQMVERMRQDYSVDPRRIYVTGISAGAAMTLALAAAYPEVFAGAAPVAGIAFGCADGLLSALGCMREPPDKTPAEWGAAVRSASSHKGPWPRISVWQGDADSTVNPANEEAILRQWTNVHGIEDAAKQVDGETRGDLHTVFRGSKGQTLVEGHRIKGMGHGLPVDPGSAENQCGKVGMFFPDVDICSSIYIARFWELDPDVRPKSTSQREPSTGH